MVKKEIPQNDGSTFFQVGMSSRYLYTDNETTADRFINITLKIKQDYRLQNTLKELKSEEKEINQDITYFKDIIRKINLIYNQISILDGL
jgi:hypothetical protein